MICITIEKCPRPLTSLVYFSIILSICKTLVCSSPQLAYCLQLLPIRGMFQPNSNGFGNERKACNSCLSCRSILKRVRTQRRRMQKVYSNTFNMNKAEYITRAHAIDGCGDAFSILLVPWRIRFAVTHDLNSVPSVSVYYVTLI